MNKKAFTLIELMVAVSVFTTVLAIGSGVFISAIRLQRKALSTQKLLDEVSFAAEYMSRAIRMAKKDAFGDCLSQGGLNYENPDGDLSSIRFLNYDNKCQQFYLDGGKLKEMKSFDETEDSFTPPLPFISEDFEVTSFNIELLGPGQADNIQPRVTFFLEVEGKSAEKPKIQLQTTISQRNPDIGI